MVELGPEALVDDEDDDGDGSSLLEPDTLKQINKLLENDMAQNIAAQFGLVPAGVEQAQQVASQASQAAGDDGGQVDADQMYDVIRQATGAIAKKDPEATVQEVHQQLEENPEQIKQLITNFL